MRTLIAAGLLALVVSARSAAAQNEAALRAAFEGKTVALRIEMPATSEGIDVYPLDTNPVNFHQVAQRLKDNGTAIRIGQHVMVTKIVVKGDSHIEFQLGGGGYGTFGDMVSNGSIGGPAQVGETKEEKALRESIKRTSDRDERKRLERELDRLRSTRARENARAAAEIQQANMARESLIRARRVESGSRFNIRYRGGIPRDGLTADAVMQALAAYVEFSNAPASAGSISALRKGQTVQQVEALLGPAVTATEVKEGSMTITKRTYRRDGMHILASFASGVLVDFAITPQ